MPRLAHIRRRHVALLATVSAVVVTGAVACATLAPNLAPRVDAPVPRPAAATLDAASSAPAPAGGGSTPAAVAAAQTNPDGASTGAVGSTLPELAQAAGTMVIRNATLTIEATDVGQALADARQIAQQAGGYVSASSSHTERIDGQDQLTIDLTLQVRSDSTDATLTALRALGTVTTESSTSQDVTEEYVDLDANLRNLRASETAIVGLMDKATRIDDVLSLQRELTNVRGQIERLQGRQRYLERRSDMSTITLSLRPPGASQPRPTPTSFDPLGTAQRGWQASLNLLRSVAEVVLIGVAFSWWLLPPLALFAYFWTRRRRRSGTRG
jgi:hypothetical protein